MQQGNLKQQGAEGQKHRELEQLGAVPLTPGQHRRGRCYQGCHHEPGFEVAAQRVRPEEAGHSQPGQAGRRAQALGQQQGGGHQQGQGAHLVPQPELAALNHQQHRQGQQGLTGFQAGTPAPHHQQHHARCCQGLN